MSGACVNIPQPQAPYNASKAAVRHMASSLAVEWATKKIRVNGRFNFSSYADIQNLISNIVHLFISYITWIHGRKRSYYFNLCVSANLFFVFRLLLLVLFSTVIPHSSKLKTISIEFNFAY